MNELAETAKGQLKAKHVRLVGMFSFDVGEIANLAEIRTAMDLDRPDDDLFFLERNPRFFDAASSKPFLVACSINPPSVVDIIPSASLVPPSSVSAMVRVCQMLKGAVFKECCYLSASGIGVLFFAVELHELASTDEIIMATNALVKYDSIIKLSEGADFNVASRIREWRKCLKPYVVRDRTQYVREYSVIHVLELDDQMLLAANQARGSVYDLYENEWHALSVRTIENWQARYPKGLPIREPNQAISPAGVLKINMRNTVVYEHPYSMSEVIDLYDPVFVETRVWDMLVAVQLQTAQQIVEQYENADYSDVSGEMLVRVKRSALRTFNEFDGFYLSTSKRTRNLYEIADAAFQTHSLLGLLKDKVEQLDAVLAGIHLARQELRSAESGRQQRNLLERAQETTDREGATRLVLSLIGVVTGLSLALSVSATFQMGSRWSVYLMGIFGLLFAGIYTVARLWPPETQVAARAEFRVRAGSSAEDVVAKIVASAGRQFRDAMVFDTMRSVVILDLNFAGRRYRVRADLATEVAGFDDEANGILEVEAIASSRRAHISTIGDMPRECARVLAQLSGGSLVVLD